MFRSQSSTSILGIPDSNSENWSGVNIRKYSSGITYVVQLYIATRCILLILRTLYVSIRTSQNPLKKESVSFLIEFLSLKMDIALIKSP